MGMRQVWHSPLQSTAHRLIAGETGISGMLPLPTEGIPEFERIL